MTTYTYDPTVPNGNDPPRNDQPFMQTNSASIFGIIGVDHVGFNIANGGAHKQTQLKETLGGSGTIPIGLLGNTYETIYSSVTSGSGDLWFVRGASPTGIQLTGPGTPSALANGYTFLPGGLLIQWGVVNTTSSSGTVTFSTANIAFPNNCFNVQTTAKYNSGVGTPSSQANYAPDSMSISPTSFNWTLVTSSSLWRGFYWIAIGN
jgi:hypothetical protein